MTEPRRVRTQAERDADGTTWQAADAVIARVLAENAHAIQPRDPNRPGPQWRDIGDIPTPDDEPRCTWAGGTCYCTGRPGCQMQHDEDTGYNGDGFDDEEDPGGEPSHAPGCLGDRGAVMQHCPAEHSQPAPPRRRWWHRYTRRNP